MNAMLRKILILGIILAFGLAAGLAQAKTLDAGTFYIEPKVGYYGNSNSRIGSMFAFGAEGGFFPINGLSLGAELLGYSVYQKKNPFSNSNVWENVGAFSPIAMARYHFINEQAYSVFAGIGLGGFFSDTRIPRNGYTSNFTEVGEIGFNVFITEMVRLQMAGRYQHVGEWGTNDSWAGPRGFDNWGGNASVKFVF
jgi:outer membrane protein W